MNLMSWFRKSKPKEPRVLHVEATGREDGKLVVIGYEPYGLSDHHYIQEFGPDGIFLSERRMSNKETYWKSIDYFSQGVENLGRYLSGIKIYQLSPERLETETGKKVEVLSTGKSDEFLEVHESLLKGPFIGLVWDVRVPVPKNTLLRWAAYQLGADALVLYQAGSPARATPVRYICSK